MAVAAATAALCCSTVPPDSRTRILLRLAIGQPDALKTRISVKITAVRSLEETLVKLLNEIFTELLERILVKSVERIFVKTLESILVKSLETNG